MWNDTGLWGATLNSRVTDCQCYEGMYCLHLEGQNIPLECSKWHPCHSIQCGWPESSTLMLLKLQISQTVCVFFCPLYWYLIFLLLAMSSLHYNIRSQIKQGVTVMMLFRSESITSSTMCLQRKKCLFTGVTKTAKCKIKLWNLFVNILSFSLFHHRRSTANLNSKWYLVHTHTREWNFALYLMQWYRIITMARVGTSSHGEMSHQHHFCLMSKLNYLLTHLYSIKSHLLPCHIKTWSTR
jgi:hypothetical protein